MKWTGLALRNLVLLTGLIFCGFSCTSETMSKTGSANPGGTTRAAMAVSHPTEKFYDCLKCHNSGRKEAAPADHDGYKNDGCLTCHAPK